MAGTNPYRLHPLAWEEIEAAEIWYTERSSDAGVAFIAAVSEALENVSEAPHRWPKHLHGTRQFMLHRFPFSVIYLDELDMANIVAVATISGSRGIGKDDSQPTSWDYSDIP
jgi:plasmid stabilization system protein ParE